MTRFYELFWSRPRLSKSFPIKECPLCGQDAAGIVEYHSPDDGTLYAVKCYTCGITSAYFKEEFTAIDRWKDDRKRIV